MILPVVTYGNPVLRAKGARIASVTPEIEELIADMLETMYSARGIGLAAQQIGRAMQLTVIDIRGITDRPSTLWTNGKETDVNQYMPLTLINPEITPLSHHVKGPEGCLSFPEIFADISRPEKISVTAMNEKGQSIRIECSGLLARAIQHETDHLHGILFIDRMTAADKADLQDELDALQDETKEMLKRH